MIYMIYLGIQSRTHDEGFFICVQVNQYQELKELVHKKVATLTQQREKLLWEQKADMEKMSFDKRRQKETEVYIIVWEQRTMF